MDTVRPQPGGPDRTPPARVGATGVLTVAVPVVSNEAFLRAVFGPDWADAHVCGFPCDPNAAGPPWAGGRWSAIGQAISPRDNTYFTISTFNDDPAGGRAKRRKALFRATHAIVVDDVGTKVDPAATAKLPPPSWKLETSPGNWQWGYILATPETDAGRVNALLDGMVARGLCADGRDPGMKGVTRYVRLPVGRNTKAKYGPGGFACVLTEWRPERRFTMDELAGPWGIDLPAPGTTPAAGQARAHTGAMAAGDAIYPYLEGWGLVDGTRAADGQGFVCECPWIAEHTQRADTGAAYYLGGGFCCHHGHGGDKGRGELVAWVDARLRAEGGAGLASEEFKGADERQISAFYRGLAAGRVPTSRDIDDMARVPNRGDVGTMFRAAVAILGGIASRTRRRLARARNRIAREAHRQCQAAACGTAIPAPAGWTAPVPLAEAQAETERGLRSVFDAFEKAGGAAPAGTVPLRDGGRRKW
jgi:hypothetical protein